MRVKVSLFGALVAWLDKITSITWSLQIRRTEPIKAESKVSQGSKSYVLERMLTVAECQFGDLSLKYLLCVEF